LAKFCIRSVAEEGKFNAEGYFISQGIGSKLFTVRIIFPLLEGKEINESDKDIKTLSETIQKRLTNIIKENKYKVLDLESNEFEAEDFKLFINEIKKMKSRSNL
jgi:hypothetical protein